MGDKLKIIAMISIIILAVALVYAYNETGNETGSNKIPSITPKLIIPTEPKLNLTTKAVFIDTDDAYISAFPETITASDYVESYVELKSYDGPVDIVFKSNSPLIIPKQLQIYDKAITYDTFSNTCAPDSYTVKDNNVICLAKNGSVEFSKDFTRQDKDTFYWTIQRETGWKSVAEFKKVDDWTYVVKGIDFQKLQGYRYRYFLDINTKKALFAKYDISFIPSEADTLSYRTKYPGNVLDPFLNYTGGDILMERLQPYLITAHNFAEPNATNAVYDVYRGIFNITTMEQFFAQGNGTAVEDTSIFFFGGDEMHYFMLNETVWNYVPGNDDFTIIMWYYWVPAEGDGAAQRLWSESTTRNDVQIQVGDHQYCINPNAAGCFYANASGLATPSVWTMVTYACNADGTWTFYQNDTQILYNNTASCTSAANTAWHFGEIQNHAGRSWGGNFDNLMIFNKSINYTDVAEIYAARAIWNETGPATITASLSSPIDFYNTSSSTITFNCSATSDAAIKNITLFIDGAVNSTLLNDTANQLAIYFQDAVQNIDDGVHNWSCKAGGDAGANYPAERNFTIDTTEPKVIIYAPTNKTYNTTNGVKFEVNATDLHLNNCSLNLYNGDSLYNFSDNFNRADSNYIGNGWINSSSTLGEVNANISRNSLFIYDVSGIVGNKGINVRRNFSDYGSVSEISFDINTTGEAVSTDGVLNFYFTNASGRTIIQLSKNFTSYFYVNTTDTEYFSDGELNRVDSIRITNINYSANTYDIYVNGVSKGSGQFYNSSVSITGFNFTSSAALKGMHYIDNFVANFSTAYTTYSMSCTGSNCTNASAISQGHYKVNFTCADTFNNINDTEGISFTYDIPANLTQGSTTSGGTFTPYVNNTFFKNETVNFTANITDALGWKNITINITNASGSEVNATTTTGGTGLLRWLWGLPVRLVDGLYRWVIYAYDLSDNYVITPLMSLFVDTTPPSIVGADYNTTWQNDDNFIYYFNATVTETYQNNTGLEFGGTTNYTAYNTTATQWQTNFTWNVTYVPYNRTFQWWAYDNATNFAQSAVYNFNITCPAGYKSFNNTYCEEDITLNGNANRYLTIPNSIHSITSSYINIWSVNATNLNLSIGSKVVFNNPGITNATQNVSNRTVNLANYINNYMNSTYLFGSEYRIPFVFHSDDKGVIRYYAINYTVGGILEDTLTSNFTAYETAYEGFNYNLTYDNGTYTSAVGTLYYKGVGYTGTENRTGTYSVFTRAIDIPTGIGNNSYYWQMALMNATDTYYYNSSKNSQIVNSTNFTYCTGDGGVTMFLNFTFANENTGAQINASNDLTSNVYFLGMGTTYRILTTANVTENWEYNFCALPNKTFINNMTFKYSSTGYPLRTFTYQSQNLTNSPTHRVLYLLGSSDGIYSSIRTASTSGAAISNVLIQYERQIAGIWTLIGQEITGDDGIATFWLDPDYQYRFTASKSGYANAQVTIQPTQSTYTLVMSAIGENLTYVSEIAGVAWYVYPASGPLQPRANQQFNATVISSQGNLENCRFELLNGTNSNNSALASSTSITNSTYCYMSFTYNTKVNQNLFGRLSLDTTNTTGFVIVDSDWKWVLIDMNNTQAWSKVTSLFADLTTMSDFGEGNEAEYNRIVFFFLISTILIGVFVFFSGVELTNPGLTILILWGIVLIASIGGFLTYPSGNTTNSPLLFRQFGLFIILSLFVAGYFLGNIRRTGE